MGTSRGSSPDDYDPSSPPEVGPAEAKDLTALSLPLLDRARWRASCGEPEETEESFNLKASRRLINLGWCNGKQARLANLHE